MKARLAIAAIVLGLAATGCSAYLAPHTPGPTWVEAPGDCVTTTDPHQPRTPEWSVPPCAPATTTTIGCCDASLLPPITRP